MVVVQQRVNTLPQARWPVLDLETGCATVAFTRGVDRLAWAKTSKDSSAGVPERQAEAADEGVRLDKVERLRAAIADGTYCVSAEALADRMIEHMREVDTLDGSKDRR